MAKISPVSAKYIVHSTIEIEGVVDRPDVIGAIFGQTEGLLGADLELRELQRSGKIGRIEVNVDTRGGKTKGEIIIPSSLDKAETSIVGAALEVIQRIGPCNAKIGVTGIEDVRVSKRAFVIERAKELLKSLMDNVMPDSQELADEVASSVRMMEVQEYGKDRLPAGPAIDESDEVIVVEGRADVLNLLKHGFKNVISMNGTSVPETIIELSKRKILTAFVDGDRGGELIVRELLNAGEIDYVTRAPDGKEVEEITKKEIHKALRGRIASEQAKLEFSRNGKNGADHRQQLPKLIPKPQQRFDKKITKISPDERKAFREMLEDLIGTRGAYILDEKLNILGKVPITELTTTMKNLSANSVHAVVFDGNIEIELVKTAERMNVNYLIAMDSRVRPNDARVGILTSSDF